MKRAVLQIPLVVLDPVCVQQRLQLLHESALLVVGRLILDIAPHRLELRRAHSERRLSTGCASLHPRPCACAPAGQDTDYPADFVTHPQLTAVAPSLTEARARFSRNLAGRTIRAVGELEQVKAEKNVASDADDALRFAAQVARIADENKTEDVAVLDLRGLSSLTDFFVIGTGTSDRQMHAIVDLVEEHAKTVGRSPFKVADTRKADWILADYVDVVIHLFDARHRDYYDLDGLWGDAPQVDWRQPASQEPPQSAE